MERSQIWQYIPIFVMFTWMMVTPFLFPHDWTLRYLANMLGMVISISFLVVTNEMLKWKASEFTHYDCICRPSRNRLHLFITTLESVEIPQRPGFYATALTLGDKLEHSFYGTIEKGGQVVITHWGEWEKRMVLGKGKAIFKDQVVDHAKSCMIVLYEPPDTFDMDHLSPIPVFELAEAPGDFYIAEDYQLLKTSVPIELLKKKVLTGGETMTGAVLLKQYLDLKRDSEDLKIRNSELSRQAHHWHQEAVRGEEVLKQVKNELHAVLSSRSDMKQAVVEQVATSLEAHTKIRNALKELKPVNWLSRALVMLILGVMTLGVFLMNPGGVLQWLSVASNQFFVFIIVLAVAFVYFYTQQRKK